MLEGTQRTVRHWHKLPRDAAEVLAVVLGSLIRWVATSPHQRVATWWGFNVHSNSNYSGLLWKFDHSSWCSNLWDLLFHQWWVLEIPACAKSTFWYSPSGCAWLLAAATGSQYSSSTCAGLGHRSGSHIKYPSLSCQRGSHSTWMFRVQLFQWLHCIWKALSLWLSCVRTSVGLKHWFWSLQASMLQIQSLAEEESLVLCIS